MNPTSARSSALQPQIPGVRVVDGALPTELFAQLVHAVREIGDDRIEKNYTTTFWYPRDIPPGNIAERCATALLQRVQPGAHCVGMEWWIGRLRHDEKLRYHFDRDMTIRKKTGRFVHPMHASILYLNESPASPTTILDQIISPDGKSRVPTRPTVRDRIPAEPNRYVIFPGNLRHGVLPRSSGNANGTTDPYRLTFLVNFWDRRPLPPLCFDYDGSIYPSLAV